MTDFEPTLGTGTLLRIAAGAVALLLLLIIQFRVHAFIALVLVRLLTALTAGIPPRRSCPCSPAPSAPRWPYPVRMVR